MSFNTTNEKARPLNAGLIAYISCSSPEFKANEISLKEKHLREAAKKLGYKQIEVYTVVGAHIHRFAQEDSAKILLAAQNMAEKNLDVHVAIDNHKKCMRYINDEMKQILSKACNIISELDEIFITVAQYKHQQELQNLSLLDEEEKPSTLVDLLIKALDAAKRVLITEKTHTNTNSR